MYADYINIGETKDDADEDGAKSTNNVKSAKPGTGVC